MTYCAVADVQQVLNPLGRTPSPASAAALPSAVLSGLIDEAETTVNGFLATRYDVPFDSDPDDTVPDLVARVTAIVAAFLAVTVAADNQSIPPTHPMAIRYQQALGTLQALASGRMTLSLPATDGETPDINTTAAQPTPTNITNVRAFTPGDYGLGPAPDRPFGAPRGYSGLPI